MSPNVIFFFFFTIWVNEFSARLRVSIKLSLLAPSSTACLISVPCAACKLIDVSSIMDSHPYARIFEGTFCFHGPCRRCAVGNASGFARRASPVASGISEARARPPLNDHEHFWRLRQARIPCAYSYLMGRPLNVILFYSMRLCDWFSVEVSINTIFCDTQKPHSL